MLPASSPASRTASMQQACSLPDLRVKRALEAQICREGRERERERVRARRESRGHCVGRGCTAARVWATESTGTGPLLRRNHLNSWSENEGAAVTCETRMLIEMSEAPTAFLALSSRTRLRVCGGDKTTSKTLEPSPSKSNDSFSPSSSGSGRGASRAAAAASATAHISPSTGSLHTIERRCSAASRSTSLRQRQRQERGWPRRADRPLIDLPPRRLFSATRAATRSRPARIGYGWQAGAAPVRRVTGLVLTVFRDEATSSPRGSTSARSRRTTIALRRALVEAESQVVAASPTDAAASDAPPKSRLGRVAFGTTRAAPLETAKPLSAHTTGLRPRAATHATRSASCDGGKRPSSSCLASSLASASRAEMAASAAASTCARSEPSRISARKMPGSACLMTSASFGKRCDKNASHTITSGAWSATTSTALLSPPAAPS
eukprot:scaffold9274_cov103-Isochrysis_galbana.AAC.8